MNAQFPGMANLQSLPYNLTSAQLLALQQLMATRQEPIGDTGPATVAVIAMGAAGGFAMVRKKRRERK
ncbi:MAG: hypothetical protein ABIH58_00655 [Patescibacteria group bacterium]